MLSNGQVSEARFELYLGDTVAGLVYKPDGFPALGAYDATHFGIDVSLVDINFDGFKDIVTFGHTYTGATYPAGTPMHPTPDAFWLNDGTGSEAGPLHGLPGGQQCLWWTEGRLQSHLSPQDGRSERVQPRREHLRTVTPDAPLTILP